MGYWAAGVRCQEGDVPLDPVQTPRGYEKCVGECPVDGDLFEDLIRVFEVQEKTKWRRLM